MGISEKYYKITELDDMENLKLHHIGVVVPNIQESLGEITKYLKFETIGLPTLIGSQKVNVCFLKIEQVYLE